nr:DDE-type integrase/transposase/recombinase [Puniceibacterium antarcticum]
MKSAGRTFRLWRAVDQQGLVLEESLQSKRDTQAAKRLLTSLIRRHGFVPKRIVTDKLRSYGAAKREVASGLDHWSHKGLINRAENHHLPFRKRERSMQGGRTPGGLQGFVSIHSTTRNRFALPSRRRAALTIRYHRMEAVDAWKAAASIA